MHDWPRPQRLVQKEGKFQRPSGLAAAPDYHWRAQARAVTSRCPPKCFKYSCCPRNCKQKHLSHVKRVRKLCPGAGKVRVFLLGSETSCSDSLRATFSALCICKVIFWPGTSLPFLPISSCRDEGRNICVAKRKVLSFPTPVPLKITSLLACLRLYLQIIS